MTYAFLFLAGLVSGAAINAARYCLAWTPRGESPWSRHHPKDARDHWLDRAPLAGWFRLQRKAETLGRGFWIRPIIVELAFAAALVGLYHFEVTNKGLLSAELPKSPMASIPTATVAPDKALLHSIFFSHAVLLMLMTAASLIDIDEQTIPDAITVSGTILGLVLAAALPAAQLPALWINPASMHIEWLTIVTPNSWPPMLKGGGKLSSLAIALLFYWAWCMALLPRRYRGRHGFRRAMRLMGARITRDGSTPRIAVLAVVGSIGISAIWWLDGARWISLVSSIVGMAAGAALIWSVRILATWALRKEAMGFGDVTLMAMIGAFLGWQPCLIIFFLAPLAGLVVGIGQAIFRGETVIPYGPFLCLATGVVVLRWPAFWVNSYDMFSVPWLLPGVFSACLVMMAIMLFFWRKLKEAWFGV